MYRHLIGIPIILFFVLYIVHVGVGSLPIVWLGLFLWGRVYRVNALMLGSLCLVADWLLVYPLGLTAVMVPSLIWISQKWQDHALISHAVISVCLGSLLLLDLWIRATPPTALTLGAWGISTGVSLLLLSRRREVVSIGNFV